MKKIALLLVVCFMVSFLGCARIPRSGIIAKPGGKHKKRIVLMNKKNMENRMSFLKELDEIKEITARNG